MKTKALFVAILVGLGALSAQALAAESAAADRQGAAVSERADGSKAHARRGGKHHQRGHRGQRFAQAGRGPGAGIARLDTDGDGRISRAELEAADSRRGRGHRGGGWLLEQFDTIDADGDGHIVRSELRSWQQAQRQQRQAERARRFQERFDAADADGDGRLSRAEVDAKMPRLSASFAWMDEDGDGYLSREDLRPQRTR